MYKRAKYEKVMKCPECGWYTIDKDGMPDRHDFVRGTDGDGVEYVECPCGCRFVEGAYDAVYCPNCTAFGLDCNPLEEDWHDPCEYYERSVT